MDNNLERGIVTIYDSFKGFGFIRRAKGKDVFFHYTDITNRQEPTPGDLLEFMIVKKPKGPCAQNIKIVES